MKEGKGSFVEVELMGQKLRIRSDEHGEEYIRKVSKYVNDEIQKVAKGTVSKTTQHIALLAAMNIAENYFLELNNQKEVVDSLLVKTNKLVDYINQRLNR